jgi:hypothetical protein
MERFIKEREIKREMLGGKEVAYVELGKNTLQIVDELAKRFDGKLPYFIKNAELEITEDNRILKSGNKNVIIVEYFFNSGNWCGVSDVITPYDTVFHFRKKSENWDFITKTAGAVIQTDKDYCIVEKYFYKGFPYNTETTYLYADAEKLKELDILFK